MSLSLLPVIAAIVGLAVAARAVARLSGLSVLPLYIAAGFLLSRLVPGPPPEGMSDLLLLALAFLLFSGGLALNPARFRRTGLPRVATLAVAEVVILGSLAAALLWSTGFGPADVVQGAFAVAFSSTLLVTGLLARRGEQDVAHAAGRLALGFLLVQDVLAVVALAFMPPASLWGEGLSIVGPLLRLGALIVLGVLVWLLMRYALPWGLTALRRDPEDRNLLAFGLLFLSLVGVAALGVPAIVGPFLAGVALSPHPSNLLVRSVTRSVRDFFIPVFFVSLGFFLGPVEGVSIPLALALLALILIVKPLVVALLARASGSTLATSFETGLLAGQGSEFALAILLTAATEGAVSTSAFALLATVITLSLAVSALVPSRRLARALARRLPHETRRHYHSPHAHPKEGHVVILGAGSLGREVAARLEKQKVPTLIIDHDPRVAREVGTERSTIQGEGVDPRVLEHARAKEAEAVVALMGRPADNLHVLAHVDPAKAVIRVTSPEEAARAAEGGGTPVEVPAVLAEAILRKMDERAETPRS
ncbi:MAG TPA: cation:proton antiporter [Candidatus Thermoplasmatota archaeon]|nr:cation:proton antiporter [Candidatus Thermoplasmatota archaeon]